MKRLFLRWFFCGTPAEYEEGKRIHFSELKIYRKRRYYIAGLVLTVLPLIYLIRQYTSWDVLLCVLSVAIGNMLIRDTISEHYVVKLLRAKRPTDEIENEKEPNSEQRY